MKSFELHIPALSKPENQPNWLRHLRTINHHRMLVCQHCFRVGLYRQGLMHDLSKYNPVEFMTGVRYFQGYRSPNTAERLDKGYSSAWLHHKGRNKHHLEYWIDYSLDEDSPMAGMKMPVQYVVEMFCDRVAACKTYQKEAYTDASPLEYYEHSKTHYILHPETRALLETMLAMLAEKGEEETFAYIRHEVLNK
ncbi:DUF5662 family protein [Butyricicoccus sp.]|uniref:DUF5662 family protein n=1 Tax=Butyricicoccus sp. TaxID=2049021 RepID=UPI003F1639AF